MVNERNGGHRYQPRSSPRAPSALSRGSGGYGDAGSDIYVTSGAYKAPSEIRLVSCAFASFVECFLLIDNQNHVRSTQRNINNSKHKSRVLIFISCAFHIYALQYDL